MKPVHEQILDQIMLANYLDTNQSWELNADGNYKKIKYSKIDSFSAHEYFMNNPSLSGRADVSGAHFNYISIQIF